VSAVVVLGNIIRGKDAGKKLEKGRVEVEDREEKDDGDEDVEQVSECWVAGRNADKDAAKWVRDEQAKNQLDDWESVGCRCRVCAGYTLTWSMLAPAKAARGSKMASMVNEEGSLENHQV
jgi:hypothetical protein